MCRGIAVLILNVSARQVWVLSATLRPLYRVDRGPPHPIPLKAGWSPGLVWTCVEKRKSFTVAWLALVILNNGSYDLIGTRAVLCHYNTIADH